MNETLVVFLWGLVFLALGSLCILYGASLGRKQARLEDELKAVTNCQDTGYANPTMVVCPCRCKGVLQSDGRNKNDTLTFLACTVCHCTYVAGDSKGQETDEQYEKRTGEPRGAGADWAGRTRGDFQE